MTRSGAIFAFALTAAILGAPSAHAQPGGAPAGRGGGDSDSPALQLLTNNQVQKDLQLTDEQRVQILTVTMELRENRGMVGQRLTEILTPAQLRRLKEILLQVEGPAALNKPEVVKALGLSPGQCARLRALQEQVRAKVREVVDGTKGMSTEERQAIMPDILEKLERMRKDVTGQAIDVLTPQQREMFEKMQGAKINLEAPPPPPRAAPKQSPAKEADKSE